jgi:hypothetical protein
LLQNLAKWGTPTSVLPADVINKGLELVTDLIREGETREVTPDRCSEPAYLLIIDDSRLTRQPDEDALIDSADGL